MSAPNPETVRELVQAHRAGVLAVPLRVLARDLPRQIAGGRRLAAQARENADFFAALRMTPPRGAAGELDYRMALLEDRWRAEQALADVRAALHMIEGTA